MQIAKTAERTGCLSFGQPVELLLYEKQRLTSLPEKCSAFLLMKCGIWYEKYYHEVLTMCQEFGKKRQASLDTHCVSSVTCYHTIDRVHGLVFWLQLHDAVMILGISLIVLDFLLFLWCFILHSATSRDVTDVKMAAMIVANCKYTSIVLIFLGDSAWAPGGC